MPTLRPPNWSDFTEEEQAIFEEAAKRQTRADDSDIDHRRAGALAGMAGGKPGRVHAGLSSAGQAASNHQGSDAHSALDDE